MRAPVVLSLLLITVVLATLPPAANAHACYVIEEGADRCQVTHPNSDLLLQAAHDPIVLSLLVMTLLAPILAHILWTRVLSRRLEPLAHRMRETLRSYEDLLPWMLRLSLGIALLAAGTVGYFFTPLATATPLLATSLLALGFLLLLGVLVRIAAVVALGLFVAALGTTHLALGATEMLGAALILAILGGGRPGIDHLISRTLPEPHRIAAPLRALQRWAGVAAPYAPLALRVTLGVSLGYGALTEKLLNPQLALDVVHEHGLAALAPWPPEGWVILVGTAELLLSILFVAGFLTRAASAATFAILTATMFYFGENIATHVTLFGLASWLFTTGAGPLSLDHRLSPPHHERPSKLRGVKRALIE